MFIQSCGTDKSGNSISFIALNLEDLLNRMQAEGMERCTVCFDDIESVQINLETVTQADVKEMIERGWSSEQVRQARRANSRSNEHR